eukprot:gene4618-8585_t
MEKGKENADFYEGVQHNQRDFDKHTNTQEVNNTTERHKFVDFCSRLNLEHDTTERAWNVWCHSRSSLSSDELHSIEPWFACVVYLTTHPDFQTDKGQSSHVSVKGIFRLSQLRLQEFASRTNLDKLPQLRRSAHENAVIFHAQTILKSMEATKICVHYYHDIFKRLIIPLLKTPIVGVSNADDAEEAIGHVCEFGWLLFLTCKAMVPMLLGDISKVFCLLVCCIDFIYVNACRFPWAVPNLNENEDVLSYCCSRVARLDSVNMRELDREVHIFFNYFWRPTLSGLLENLKLPTDGPAGFFFQNQETQWSGCSSLHRMRFAVSQIKQEYHQLILLGGLVDESVFSKALEGTEASLPPATPTFKRTPLKYCRRRRFVDSPQRLPFRPKAKGLLALNVFPSNPEIHEINKSFNKLCERNSVSESTRKVFFGVLDDLTQKITEWLSCLTNREKILFPRYWRQTRALAIKTITQVILNEFQDQRSKKYIPAFLARTNILRATAALVLDIVLFYHKDNTIQFDQLLQLLDTNPFDYQQLAEIIIRNNPELATFFCRRVASCERQCLLHLVWKKTSFSCCPIKNNAPTRIPQAFPHTERVHTPPPQCDQQTVSILHLESTQRETSNITLHLYDGSEANICNRPEKSPSKEASVIFQKRLATLVHQRISAMGKLLGYPQVSKPLQLAGIFMKQIIRQPHLARLLFSDRHVDTSMLASLYAALELDGRAVSFRLLILQYRTLLDAPRIVWSGIPLNGDHERGDLVAFYNSVYLPVMNDIISSQSSIRPSSPLQSFETFSSPKNQLPSTIKFVTVIKDEIELKRSHRHVCSITCGSRDWKNELTQIQNFVRTSNQKKMMESSYPSNEPCLVDAKKMPSTLP